MKFSQALIFLTCAVYFASVQAMEDAHKKIVEGCFVENNQPPDALMKYRQGEILEKEIAEPFKCSVKCFLIKSGIWNDNGAFDIKVAEQIFQDKPQKEKFLKGLSDCNEASQQNELCERAFQVLKCVTKFMDF